jgi:hypothetical protein
LLADSLFTLIKRLISAQRANEVLSLAVEAIDVYRKAAAADATVTGVEGVASKLLALSGTITNVAQSSAELSAELVAEFTTSAVNSAQAALDVLRPIQPLAPARASYLILLADSWSNLRVRLTSARRFNEVRTPAEEAIKEYRKAAAAGAKVTTTGDKITDTLATLSNRLKEVPELAAELADVSASAAQAAVDVLRRVQPNPIIDPDLTGPDDFRQPKPGELVFDLWDKRRKWVIDRLKVFANLPKTQAGIPNINEMFKEMSRPVVYGTASITAWATSTPIDDFSRLRDDQLNQGQEVDTAKFRLWHEFHLSTESFLRLMAIADKVKAWTLDRREEEVSEAEWQEVYSILTQAQKVAFFASWRLEENENKIQFGPEHFWISLTQPQEGAWPPILDTELPTIDPALLKLKDLPDAVVGERAIALWQKRQEELNQIPNILDELRRQDDGFVKMLKIALGDPLPDLEGIKSELSNPATAASATQKIENDLHLTVGSFQQLLAIKVKVDTTSEPTAAEWKMLYTILTPPYKVKNKYSTWKTEEANLTYWQALKAKLPRWRATVESRVLWLQALLTRSQSPIIDPDLIGPGDLKNPETGDPAFDLWKSRDGEILAQLTNLQAQPKNQTGLDENFKATLGISVKELQKVTETQAKGENITDRLAQLSLEIAEFNYLWQIVQPLQVNQTALDSEWENVYSILVQVWKRRQSARWRAEEKKGGIFLSPDFFQIPSSNPLESLPTESSVVERWRAPRLAYLTWLDNLQTRLDQEQQTIQSMKEAVGAAEEATLTSLRDGLIIATDAQDNDLIQKANWLTERLFIDAATSGDQISTRAGQAIETLQSLLLALRAGRSEEPFKNLKLTQENFERTWNWVGSYTSWRSAMFVFLYPENLLQPSLRKWQTPAFQELVENVRSAGDINLLTIYQAADRYTQYFKTVINLKVQATCAAKTRIARGFGAEDDVYRTLFYMFALSDDGSLYWSIYDSKNGSSDAQSPWILVVNDDGKLIENFNGLSRIIGAISYKRHLYVFSKNESKSLLYIRYDLDEQEWNGKATLLPNLLPSDSSVILCQDDNEDHPPRLFFTRFINPGSNVIYLEVVTNELNFEGSNWKESQHQMAFQVSDAREGILSSIVVNSHESIYFLFDKQIIRFNFRGFVKIDWNDRSVIKIPLVFLVFRHRYETVMLGMVPL